jgi:pimeloyl-ACP methyl ester carboxylesterase
MKQRAFTAFLGVAAWTSRAVTTSNIMGSGNSTMVFAHGFGCDQNMWRMLAPHYADKHRVVLFE